MRISDWSSDVCSSDLGVKSAASRRRPSAAQGADFMEPEKRPGTLNSAQLVSRMISACRSLSDRIRLFCRRVPSVAASKTNLRLESLLALKSCSHNPCSRNPTRSEEHTSELQSLMRISYAVFCSTKTTTETTLRSPH